MKQLLLLLIAFSTGPLFAQQRGVTPIPNSLPTGQAGEIRNPNSTRAVVIGISDYQEKDIPDLRFADRDAEAFANFLRSPAGGSLDGDHLKVLTNQNATAGRIAEALDNLIEQAKEGDQVIIYFSGHGDVEGKKLSQPGFLLCWDSPSRVYMGGGTYSLSFLQEVVSTLAVQNKAKVVVITDACHAGKLAGSQIGGAQLTSVNLAKQYANEVKILSCQPDEYSLEGEQWGGGRGCFSYHLVEGLFGLADRNGDGSVSVGELDRYLEDHVTAEAAPQSQVPMLMGNKTERLATVNAAILADLKKAKSGGLPVFAATESRGLEEEVLAKLDSGVVKKYFAFKKAVAEKRFFPAPSGEPADDCAETFYASLSTEPGLAPLHGFLKRNYAAALQDDAQQVMNTMLKTGLTSEVLSAAKAAVIYRNYPAYLDRAAQLLGNGHYMYATLKARRHFFEGKIQTSKKERTQSFLKALQWQPELPHAFVELITTCSVHQADSAVFYATKAMEIAPKWVLPYVRLSAFYEFKLRQLEKAEAMLVEASQVDSNSMLVIYSMARFYDRKGDTQQAEQLFLKAISGSGNDICFPCAHNELGILYRVSGRHALAEEHFIKALHLNPASAPTFNEYGNLLRVMGRPADAEIKFRQAVEADSTFFNAWWNLNICFSKAGRYAEAEWACKKMIQLDSSSSLGYLSLGFIYAKTNRPVEAEFYSLKAVQMDPSAYNWFDYACILSLTNKLDKAFDALEQSIKLGENDYDWMQQDEDLAPLRALPAWKELMKKYFPDKVKD